MSENKEAKTFKIVVVGGGTGTYTVLKGLTKYLPEVELSAVVTMADSGGSTGRLRDTFGYLPVGDVRMALVALAREDDEHERLLRDLFSHRFNTGGEMKGHTFGNLLLTALRDMLGSESEAISVAARILGARGRVLPVTLGNTHLVAEYDDGLVITGESLIDSPESERVGRRIVALSVEPRHPANPLALEAIANADMIVIGPGDLYTSVLANCVVTDVAKTIADSQAMLVYVSNLMSRPGQTRGMSVGDHVLEIEHYLGRKVDKVLYNDTPLPVKVLERYRLEGDEPLVVRDNDDLNDRLIRADLLDDVSAEPVPGDALKRSLIRHDSEKLADVLVGNCIKSNYNSD